MPNKDKVRQVYDDLSEYYDDLGTPEEFEEYMADRDTREKAYGLLKKHYNVKNDLQSFHAAMGYDDDAQNQVQTGGVDAETGVAQHDTATVSGGYQPQQNVSAQPKKPATQRPQQKQPTNYVEASAQNQPTYYETATGAARPQYGTQTGQQPYNVAAPETNEEIEANYVKPGYVNGEGFGVADENYGQFAYGQHMNDMHSDVERMKQGWEAQATSARKQKSLGEEARKAYGQQRFETANARGMAEAAARLEAQKYGQKVVGVMSQAVDKARAEIEEEQKANIQNQPAGQYDWLTKDHFTPRANEKMIIDRVVNIMDENQLNELINERYGKDFSDLSENEQKEAMKMLEEYAWQALGKDYQTDSALDYIIGSMATGNLISRLNQARSDRKKLDAMAQERYGKSYNQMVEEDQKVKDEVSERMYGKKMEDLEEDEMRRVIDYLNSHYDLKSDALASELSSHSTTGLYQQGLSQYEAGLSGWTGAAIKGAAGFATMVADSVPFMIAGGIGGFFGNMTRGAFLGRALAGVGGQFERAVIMKGVLNSAKTQAVNSMVASGLTFGLYDAASAGVQSYASGNFSFGDMVMAGTKGFGKGALLGGMNTALHKMGERYATAAGKAGVAKRVGISAGGYAGEVAFFTAMEQIEKNGLTFDNFDWASVGEQAVLIGLMKMKGEAGKEEMWKDPKKIIENWRKPIAKELQTDLTKEDIETLVSLGYGKKSKSLEEWVNSLYALSVNAETGQSRRADLEGALMDAQVPLEIRRKILYGYGVVTPEAMAWSVSEPVEETSEAGNKTWTVTSYTENSKPLQIKRFANKREAEAWAENIKNGQVKNHITMMEQMAGPREKEIMSALYEMSKEGADTVISVLKGISQEGGGSLRQLIKSFNAVMNGKGTEAEKAMVNEAIERAEGKIDEIRTSVVEQARENVGWDTMLEEALKKEPEEWTKEERERIENYRAELRKLDDEVSLDPRVRMMNRVTTSDGKLIQAKTAAGETLYVPKGVVVKENGEIDMEATKNNAFGGAVLVFDQNGENPRWMRSTELAQMTVAPDASALRQQLMETYDVNYGAQVGNIVKLRNRMRRSDGVIVVEEKEYKVLYVAEDGTVRLEATDGSGEIDSTQGRIEYDYMTQQQYEADRIKQERMNKPMTAKDVEKKQKQESAGTAFAGGAETEAAPVAEGETGAPVAEQPQPAYAPAAPMPVDENLPEGHIAEIGTKIQYYDPKTDELKTGTYAGPGSQPYRHKIVDERGNLLRNPDGTAVEMQESDIILPKKAEAVMPEAEPAAPVTDNAGNLAEAPVAPENVNGTGTDASGMKVDANGMPTMENDPKAVAESYMNGAAGMEYDEAKQVVDWMINDRLSQYQKLQKKHPEFKGNMIKYQQEKAAWQQQVDQIKAEGEWWRSVQNEFKAREEAAKAKEEAIRQQMAAEEQARIDKIREEQLKETQERERKQREFMAELERKRQEQEALEAEQANEELTGDEMAEQAVMEEQKRRERMRIGQRLAEVGQLTDLDQPADETMAAQVAYLSPDFKVTPESLRLELGSNFGKFGREGMLRLADNNGRTISEIADAITQAAGYDENGQWKLDANKVREELIKCIQEGSAQAIEALEKRVGIGTERPEDRPEYWTPEKIAEYEARQQQNQQMTEVLQQIAEASEMVNTSPTDAQKEAGNYKKGHVKLDGMEISIEQPKGSTRSGVDADGLPWSVRMNNTYGYIRGTKGKDKDHIDIFLSDNPEEGSVFVVDQIDPRTGEFDEHKVMYGFNNLEEAREAYLSNYMSDWQGLGNITEVNKTAFKVWLSESVHKTKPFADYRLVKAEQAKMGIEKGYESGRDPFAQDRTGEFLNGNEGYETIEGDAPFHAVESGKNTPVDIDKAKQVAKSLGLHVSLEQQDPVKGADGMIDSNGLVSVNMNSPKGAGWLISHESGHRVEKLAPVAYNEYKKAALGMLTAEEVQRRIDLKREAYKEIGLDKSDEQLKGEIVNDMMGDIFAEPGKIDALIKKSSPTMWRGIMNAIEDMWAMLTGKSRDNAYQVYKKLRDALKEARGAYNKEIGDAAARIETKLAKLNRPEAVSESSISDDGNLSSSGSHVDDGTRLRSGAQKDGAKIRKDFVNRKDLTKKMANFVKKMSESEEITPENWYKELMHELGFETHEGQASQYFSFMTPDGRLVSVRMSGHHAKARNYKNQAGDEHYSIVVQVENWDDNFTMKTSDKIRLHEYHYAFPDKERLTDIAKSLFGLVDEGKYSDFAWADTQGESPRLGGEPFMFAQISDENYRHIIKQITSSDLHVDEKAEAISRMQKLRLKGEELIEKTLSADQLHGVELSIREKEEPKKKGIGYKVFYRNPKDGKLYPPMVANPNGADTPVGVWLDADAAPIVGQTKTGRNQVKAGGKGTQGGSGQLAYRPGWHLGEIPYALQFGRMNPETGKKDLFPKDFVWAEVEYAADKDYQDEAYQAGINANGKYQHSLAGLPHLPEDGYYRYRTNPNPETDPWIITGAMKVNRVLSNEEVDDLVRKAGREPQKREGATVKGMVRDESTIGTGNDELLYNAYNTRPSRYDEDTVKLDENNYVDAMYTMSTKYTNRVHDELQSLKDMVSYNKDGLEVNTQRLPGHVGQFEYTHIGQNDIVGYRKVAKNGSPYDPVYGRDLYKAQWEKLEKPMQEYKEFYERMAEKAPQPWMKQDLMSKARGVEVRMERMKQLAEGVEPTNTQFGRWAASDNGSNSVRYRDYEGENEQLKKASEEHMKAVENGDMETAQKLVDEAAKAAGYTIHAYHGTNRADRVGTEFKPERATSGPMSFFTDNKGIADNYAKNKKDTSMAYDGDWDAGDYHTQFKVNVGGYAGEVRMENAWGYLPYELRNEITKKAMQVTTDDMGNIIAEEGNTRGTGGYDWNLKQRRGNAIKALVDEWLDSGNLFNREGQFMEVLEKAGVLEAFEKMGWKDARYLDPNYSEPKTYDTYLKIEKPFDTNEMYTEKFVDRLENWWNRLSKKKQAELTKESMDADHWDKNAKTIEQWVEDARYDLAHGETWAWTVIPDALTEYLKSKGYDGIIDRGGKGGGTGHNVYIPFYPEQIKSTEAVTRDAEGKVIPLSERFDTSKKDIRYNRTYSDENPFGLTNKDIDEYKRQPSDSKGAFGNIYTQFKGNAKEAARTLFANQGGDAVGVFERSDIGSVDLVWGDEKGGLKHLILDHVGTDKSFETSDEAIETIEDIINNGSVSKKSDTEKTIIEQNGGLVVIRRNIRNNGKKVEDKNWVLTSYKPSSEDKKSPAVGGTAGFTDNKVSTTRNTGLSERKGSGNKPNDQINQAEITETAEKMAENLNKKVKICQNADEISDESVKAAVKKAEAEGRTPTRKGWFNTRTGEIEVYAPAAESVEDVQKTVLHETVGHYGLRELLSDNEHDYNNAMVEMYRLMNKDQKAEVLKLMSDRKYDVATAMDEYLAKMAEDRGNMVEPGFWQKAKSVVKNLLRKIGIDVELTDGDLKYLLWSSHEALKNSHEVTNPDGSKSRVYDRKTMDQKAADWAMRWHNDVLGLRSKWEAERKAEGRGTEAAAHAEANVTEEQARKAAEEAVKNRDTDPDDEPTTPGGGSTPPTGGRERSLEEMINLDAQKFKTDYENMKTENDQIVLGARVREFIRNRMTPLAGKRMTASDINGLLRDVDMAITHKNKKGLERALDRMQTMIHQAEGLAQIEEMMKTLNTRTTTQDKRGMVKGVLVDETANEVLTDIKSSYKQMLSTSYDERLSEVRLEMRALKEQYGITRQDDPKAPEEFKAKMQELKDKQETLKAEREGVVNSQVDETVESLKAMEDDIRNQIGNLSVNEDGDAVTAKPERLAKLEQKLITLEIRKQLAELRQMMKAKQEIQKEHTQTGSPKERHRLEKEIDEMQRRINGTSRDITEKLKDVISEGRSRRAEWVKADIERQMKIVRMGCNAERDADVPDTLDKKNGMTTWGKVSNWAARQRDMHNSPLFSFNFMAKYIDHNNAYGEGEFYDYFMRSKNGALEANNKMSKGNREFAESLNNKTKEIFGKEFDKVKAEASKLTDKKIFKLKAEKSIPEEEWDEKYVRMTKGQMLYAWLTWRQEAGRTKMEADGWTKRSIDEMEEQLGPEMLELGRWITDDFLKALRDDKYNVTYEKVMGTSMHKANHYFPLRIDKLSIQDKSEVGQDGTINLLPSASSGNLIVRTTNRMPVDLSNDAFDVLMDYGRTMERWNAMAELTKDLNTLIKSQGFRNLMEANHEGLFERWKDACAVATASYKPKGGDDIDDALSTLHNGFMQQAIGFGYYTAIKQTLSAPAFWLYSWNPKYWGTEIWYGNVFRTYQNYQWAKENLPSFAERIAANDFGIEAINDKSLVDYLTRKFKQGGMFANKLVDAMTVANGARGVYEYDRRRFKKMLDADGNRKYTDEQAEELAKVNAQIVFNESQQSSRNEFSAPIQKDRGIMARSATAFQNSNIGYRRMMVEGLEDIFRKDGNMARGFAKVLTVGILNAAWYMGLNPALTYNYFTGKTDDEEDKKFWSEMLKSVVLGYVTNGTILGPAMTAWTSEFGTYNPIQVFDLVGQKLDDAKKQFEKEDMGAMTWAIIDNALKFGGVNLEKFDGMYSGVYNMIKRRGFKADDVLSFLNMARTQRRELAEHGYDKPITEYIDDVMHADKKVMPGDRGRAWWGGDAYNKEITEKRAKEIVKTYMQHNQKDWTPYDDQLTEVSKKAQELFDQMKEDPENKRRYASNHKTDVITKGSTFGKELWQDAMDEAMKDKPELHDIVKRYMNTEAGPTNSGGGNAPKDQQNETYQKRYDRLKEEVNAAAVRYANGEITATTLEDHMQELDFFIERLMKDVVKK